MRKLLVLLLLVAIGSSLWATEGEWTYSEDGSYSIKYDNSVMLWRSFRRLTEGCILVGESQIPVRFGDGVYRIDVILFNQTTMIRLIDNGYYSWYIIIK